MAYSNWTITGTGTSAAELNSTAPCTWNYGVLPAQFGTYCRKLNNDGPHYLRLNKPEFTSVPVGKTQSIQYCSGFGPAGPGDTLTLARSRVSTGGWGYGIGAYYGWFCIVLNNGDSFLLQGQWNFLTPWVTYTGGFVPLKLVVKSIDQNTDELEAFVERSGPTQSDLVQPGSGIWVSNSIQSYINNSSNGLTPSGNKLIIPSTNPCFAPHTVDSYTGLYSNGVTTAYIDGFKTTVSDT